MAKWRKLPIITLWMCKLEAFPSSVAPYCTVPQPHAFQLLSSVPKDTLYIFDGTSMLFKAYYRSRENRTSYLAANGATEVGGVQCMSVELARFLRDVRPRHIAVCFDVNRETTFRRMMDPNYKLQRKSYPDDIIMQIPLAKSAIQAMGCSIFSCAGYEADDVMATLARAIVDVPFEKGSISRRFPDVFCSYSWATTNATDIPFVVLMSDDKDMRQIVNENVYILTPGSKGKNVWGPADISSHHGLPPHRLVDMTALAGDYVDNIRGVRGVGPKKALELLKRFNRLENVFDRADEILTWGIRGTASLHRAVTAPDAKRSAMLGRELARLVRNVPINGLDTLSKKDVTWNLSRDECEKVFSILGFTSPLEVLFSSSPNNSFSILK